MAGEPTGTVTALPTEVQEKLTRLEKLEKDNAALGYKLRAWEKIAKDGGDVFAYDQQGNPVGFNVEPDPAPAARPAAGNGQHPLSSFLGEGDYSGVDSYYGQRFVSAEQYRQDIQRVYQQAMNDALANIHLFRGLDKTLSAKEYADLAKYDSEWAKRTAQVLQENQWGRPLDGAASWDQWQYANPQAFKIAADIAQAKLYQAQQAQSASADQAKQAQQAAGLVSGVPGSGTTVGKPDEAWKEALDKGDTAGFDRQIKEDAAAALSRMTGQTYEVKP